MGVQLFLGKFYQCIDAETKIKLNASYVPNKEACLARNHTVWYNPPINFDHVPNAYLALFQVVCFVFVFFLKFDKFFFFSKRQHSKVG